MNIIYCKINRMRIPRFQVQTMIVEDNGTLVVKKKTLVPEARGHIASIFNNAQNMFKYFPNHYFPHVKVIDIDTIEIEYVTNQSMEKRLFEAITKKDKNKFLSLLKEFCNFVQSLSIHVDENNDFTDIDYIFDQVFIKNAFEMPTNKTILNFDLNMDNILFHENFGYFMIDCEWVFKTSIDPKFAIYRSLDYLYNRYFEYLRNFINIDEMFNFCNISSNEVTFYSELEIEFQKFIHGENADFAIKDSYVKEHKNVFMYIDSLETLVREKESDLKKLTTVQAEKDTLANHLESIYKSRSWKLVSILSKLRGMMQKLF